MVSRLKFYFATLRTHSSGHAHHSGDGFENAFLGGNFLGMLTRAHPFIGDAGREGALFALFRVLHILYRPLRKLLGGACIGGCCVD